VGFLIAVGPALALAVLGVIIVWALTHGLPRPR
jgi:hypothetical protein